MDQQLFTAIVDESPDDVLVLEPKRHPRSGEFTDAQIVFANESAALNAHTSVPQLIGQSVLQAFPHWQDNGFWKALCDAIGHSKGTSDRFTGTHNSNDASIGYSLLICGLEKTAVVRLRDLNAYNDTVKELEKQKQVIIGVKHKLTQKDRVL